MDEQRVRRAEEQLRALGQRISRGESRANRLDTLWNGFRQLPTPISNTTSAAWCATVTKTIDLQLLAAVGQPIIANLVYDPARTPNSGPIGGWFGLDTYTGPSVYEWQLDKGFQLKAYNSGGTAVATYLMQFRRTCPFINGAIADNSFFLAAYRLIAIGG